MSYESYRGLETKILIWGDARGITKHGTAEGQAKKAVEEAEELLAAVRAGDRDGAIDAIGDTLVTLIMTGSLLDLDVVDCLHHAYNQIKDRKGHMGPDGIFHKE